MPEKQSTSSRILKLLRLEKTEIGAIYFYAILNGLIQLAIPVGIQALIGFAQTNTASSSIVLLIVAVVASVLMAGVMQVKQMGLIEKIQQQLFVRYSFEIAEKLPSLKLTAIDNYYLPELANRFFDITTLQKSLAKLLLDFPLAIIQILFGLILLGFYHPIFIGFGVVLVAVIWLLMYLTGSKGMSTSIEESDYKYKVAAWFEEVARIPSSIKFSKSPLLNINRTDDNVTHYLKARTSHFRILQFQYKILIFFKVLVTAAMLIVGVILLLNQQLNVGQFIAAEIVILTIINSVEKLIGNLDSVYDVLTAVEKIEKITDKESEQYGTMPLEPGENGLSVTLNGVSFSYPGASESLFSKLSFDVAAGERVCVQGEEGAGKSTLLRLLTGSYDNFDGAVLINQVPINNYNLPSLRLQTGIMISQQSIFEGTLWDNICMGLENVNRAELLQLCEKTGLNTFVANLKMGFDSMLYTSGRKLPANVVKKILLVRALINKPKLLLLEEPWAGLDTNSQFLIKKLLLDELRQCTIIIVTKDEEFAASCDKTIFLNHTGCNISYGNLSYPMGGEGL